MPLRWKTFQYFTVKDGLCSNYVWNIQQDKADNLWFDTRDGICRYDGTHFTLVRDKQSYSGTQKIDTTNWRHETGSLWWGAHAGVYRYNGASFAYLPLPKSPFDFNRVQQPSNYISPYGVYYTIEDKADNIWCGTQSV